jgi:uncharacterized protein YwqG
MNINLTDLVNKFNLTRLGLLIQEEALPAIKISLQRVEGDISSGARSKFGGIPYLPARFDWPKYEGHPLDFLLQVDLADAAMYDFDDLLPRSGLLTVFYDLEEKPWGSYPSDLKKFKVVYLPSSVDLRPQKTSIDSDTPIEYKIGFSSMLTIPSYESHSFEKLIEGYSLSDEEIDAYIALTSKLNDLQYRTKSKDGYHRMLGHSTNVQGDMQVPAAEDMNRLFLNEEKSYSVSRNETLKTGAEDWLLLLQIDSDTDAQILWSGLGMLYFWIHVNDLRNQRFDRVCMKYQSG